MSFRTPENALKRAEELLAIGKQGDAFETLFNVIINKRFKTNLEVVETLVMKLLTLAVQQKKAKQAKDALHAFKSV